MSRKLGLLALLIGVMLVMLLAGCEEASELKKNMDVKSPSEVVGGVDSEDAEDVAEAETSGSAFSSLKDAFKSRQEIKCTFRDQRSGMSFVTYIKGEKVRTEASSEGVDVFSIYSGDMYYSWNTAQEMGMKMNIKEMEKLAADQKEQVEYQEPEEWASQYENIDIDCKKTSVPDSMFVPPSNIQFQDMTEMLLKMKEMACNMCNMIQDAAQKAECEKNC